MKHYIRTLLAVVCACLVSGLRATPPVGALPYPAPEIFVETVTRDGEGAYALLRRFDLPIDACHLDKFFALNGLTAKQSLHRDRSYKLPILRYVYDGRSIRTTIGEEDWVLAKAVQAYNRDREKSGQQSEPYEKSLELWVPFGMLNCRAAAKKPTAPAEAAPGETRSAKGYAIFGPAHAEVKVVDDALAGQHFYLIAGHGGPDPGAMAEVNENQICEDEYAYDVVLRLAREIIQHGGTPYVIVRDPDDGIRDEVYLECDYDEEGWDGAEIPRAQLPRLSQRTDAVNALAKKAKARGAKAQYCIEIHVDSRHAERQTDLFFYHQRKSDDSEDTAECIREAMVRNYAKVGRTREYEGSIRPRELYTLRETEIPTIYIELGNIQHSFDQQRVLRPGNRQVLAEWFCEGLIDRTAERAKAR